jgi:hypothetical protein
MWNLLIVSAAVAVSAAAPMATPNQGFSLGLGQASTGLLDATRFSHHHGLQYSIVSGGGQTLQQGLLLNSFDFKLHQTLDLRLHLDLAQDTPISAMRGAGATARILPGVELDYRPTENLLFHLDWGQTPYYGRSAVFVDDPFDPWLKSRRSGFSRP